MPAKSFNKFPGMYFCVEVHHSPDFHASWVEGLNFGDGGFDRLEKLFGEVGTEFGDFRHIGNVTRARRPDMFRLDLNGAFESRRTEQVCNERSTALQRPSRIIARFSGDRLERIEKGRGCSGIRLELRLGELLEVINIDGHVIFVALSSYFLLGLSPSIFPHLSRLSVVDFGHDLVPELSRVIFRRLSYFTLVGCSHRPASLSPGTNPDLGPGLGVVSRLSPFVVLCPSHGIFP